MLAKKQRLKKAEFDQYFKTGKRLHHPALQLIYHPHEHFHGAVVVGKKVYKSAVARNKLRRQLYHLLYEQYKRTNLTGVYIVLTKPGAAQVSYSELRSVVSDLLGRIEKAR